MRRRVFFFITPNQRWIPSFKTPVHLHSLIGLRGAGNSCGRASLKHIRNVPLNDGTSSVLRVGKVSHRGFGLDSGKRF